MCLVNLLAPLAQQVVEEGHEFFGVELDVSPENRPRTFEHLDPIETIYDDYTTKHPRLQNTTKGK
jgi:hypothetical protein